MTLASHERVVAQPEKKNVLQKLYLWLLGDPSPTMRWTVGGDVIQDTTDQAVQQSNKKQS